MDRIVSGVKDLTNSDIIIWWGTSAFYSDFKLESELELSTLEHVIAIDIEPIDKGINTNILCFNLSSSLLCIKDKKALVKCILDSNNVINAKDYNIIGIRVKVISMDVTISLYLTDVIENNNSELLLDVLEFTEEAFSNIEDFKDKFDWMHIRSVSEYSEEGQEAISEFLNSGMIIKG